MKKLITICAIAATVLLVIDQLQAGSIDFSTPGEYTLSTPDTYTNNETFESATIVDLGGEHGNVAQLQLSDGAGDGVDWVGAAVSCSGNFGTVRQMHIAFETYIESATGNISQTQAPYSYLGVDLNGNGQYDGSSNGDALLIPWDSIGTPVYQQWYTDGWDGTTSVHVWKNGDNVVFDGSISIDMADLADAEYATGCLWGDLDVMSIYVAAGDWNSDGYAYSAYIDNITFVPEPAMVCLLGFGALSLLIRRRRKA